MSIEEILQIVGASIGVATLVNGIIYKFWILPKFDKELRRFENTLKKEESLRENKWQIKRNSCLNALNIADNLLSNYEYPNFSKENLKPGKVTTEEVRTCFNELACSCDNS